MKKICLSFLILFLSMPFVFADITIKTDQPVYNLGNKINPSASAIHNKNFDGFFRLAIVCGNYKLQYFLTPISLEANFRTAVNVPELTVTPQMLGNCTVIGDLTTDENMLIEEQQSNNFEVTDQLVVLPVRGKIIALPSESVQVTGVVNEAFGNNVIRASAIIKLDNSSYETEVADGKFLYTFGLPSNIRSGTHTIEITATDPRINTGYGILNLDITPIPRYIKIDPGDTELQPGSRAAITASLHDQADDLINTSLDLEMTAPNDDKLFKKTVQSNDSIEYEFSQYAQPGAYLLKSTYKNLMAQSTIKITTVKEVRIKYENESVFVENVGNVPFVDELTFFLQNELKKYAITKKISVNPGKILSIDLSKEVPFGIYNIIAPLKEGLEPLKESLNETLQSFFGNETAENVLASDIVIHDNRPLYKRIGTVLSSISGSITGTNGLLARNPFIAPITLLIILSLIIFRYGRKPLMNFFRKKKDDENKEH